MSRFLRRYVVRYWYWYGSGLVFLLITNWLAVGIPLELAVAIDAMRAGEDERVLQAAWRVGAMGTAVILVRTLSRVLFFTPGRLAEFELRNDLFARMLQLQPRFYTGVRTGDLVSRAANDMQYLRVMVGFGGLQVCNVTMAVALTGYQMFALSPKLTALCIAPVLVSMVAVQAGVGRFLTLMQANQRQLSALSDHILSSLQGVRVIQGFNAQAAFSKRLGEHNQAYLNTNVSIAWIRSLVMPLLALGGSVSLYLLIAVGGPMASRGVLSVGELIAFVAFIGYLLMPLRSLGWMVSVFQRGAISLQRIDAILYAEPDRPDLPAPVPAPQGPPHIVVKGLDFSYPEPISTELTGAPPTPESERPAAERELALQGVNIDLPAGSVVGIYGRTGAGKTTLLRVLARLYNPPAGTVFIDGVDIRDIELDAWRRRMSFVPQVAFLFSDSIAANVALGEMKPDRLAEAVRNAALESDLAALPDGLDTVVGERGIMLSGGQRQRSALARGLYRDFDLLVLDDVLSAVDQKTEAQLIDTLEAISTQGREGRSRPTTLIVSHRLSVLARTDLVVVLHEGQVVDQGAHEALLARPGPYRDAWIREQDQPAAPKEAGA